MGRTDVCRYWRKEEGRKKKLKPQGIYDLLGIALGCIRISYDDFCKMDFDEFAAVYKAYADQRDIELQDEWNRMRMLACIVIQPHIDHRKGSITPEKLLPFPWDRKKNPVKQTGPKMTPEKQRERMKKLVEKLGDKLI